MSTWRDEVKKALINLGGEAALKDIYKEVERITNKDITATYTASIREALERNSSNSEAFKGKEDLFYSKGIRTGIWGIRKRQLTKNERYSREEIHDIFSPDTVFTKGSGYWGISGIIKVPRTKRDYIFLVTYGREQSKHKFNEGIDKNGILTWQSQPKQTLNDPQIQDFINHNHFTDNIYLFLRNNTKEKYKYIGLLAYKSHDPNREQPVWFKWKIIDWKKVQDNAVFDGDETYRLDNNNNQGDAQINHKKAVYIPLTRKTRKSKLFSNININFAEEARKNTNLGDKGEYIVVEYEKKRLICEGREDLAKKVITTKDLAGNAEKFDILSYEKDGTERYIEVKTTTGGLSSQFHVSEKEVEFSNEFGMQYYLYRVYNVNKIPCIKIMPGPIDRKILMPSEYIGVIGEI